MAESSLSILLSRRVSQLRINSNKINHTKNSSKVLPFHINSNDFGSKEYSQRSGTAKARSGKSLISVFVYFLRVDRMVCILCYQTRIGGSITGSFRFKKDVHSVRQVFRENTRSVTTGHSFRREINFNLLGLGVRIQFCTMIMRDYSPLQSNLLVEKLKSMTYVIFCQRKHRALGGKLLEKSLLQISLLAMAIGLISSGSLTRVFCLEVYSSANATTNNDSALRLAADVSANNTLTLSLDDLTAMPQSTENAELYCYGQLVASGYWTGVRLGLLLETAGVDQQAGSVGFHAQDGYSVTLPITEAMRPDVIIAYEKDGQPLDEGLRLVIPGANGNLWISMITNLVVLGADGNLLIGITMNSNSTISTPAISLPSASFPSSVSQPSPAPSQSPTLQSSPTPQPENQSVTSPVVPPSNDQPARQQGSPGSSLPVEYGYLILSAIIVSAAAGYLFYKRRK